MTKKNMERFTSPLKVTKASTPNAYQQRRRKLEEQLLQVQFELSQSSDEAMLNLDNDAFLRMIEQEPKIIHAKLNKVDLSGKHLDKLILVDCDVNGFIAEFATINTLLIVRTRIPEANFQNAHIAKAVLLDVTATNANFQKTELMQSWLQGDFEKSVFDDADMRETVLKGNFREVSFQKTKLTDCWFESSDIQHSNFLGADVEGITLDLVQTGVNSVTLPDGSLYIPFTNTFRYNLSKHS